MRTFTAYALCVLALQLGCSEEQTWQAVEQMIETTFPKVPTITTDSLAERFADSTATRPILLDTRSPEEYAVSHLPGARRIDPSATTFPSLDTLSKEHPVVVYCSVGYRSAQIASRLRKQGFRSVANLEGSIFRWANEGRPVVRDDTPVRAVHPYDETWGTLLETKLHEYTPATSGAN